MVSCKGMKAKFRNSKATTANTMFENDPAAKTEYCTMSCSLRNFFSSGSTNAPKIGPKKTKPVFLTGILCALATMPWENSCMTAIVKIANIQYQKGSTPNPGT